MYTGFWRSLYYKRSENVPIGLTLKFFFVPGHVRVVQIVVL